MTNCEKILEYINQTMLFLFGESDLTHLNFPYLVFFMSTSTIGLLCVLLDFSYYKTSKGKSLFGLSYIGWDGVFLMFLFWGIGAGIVGFLSARLGFIASTVEASIIMGLGWPLMFPKLYSYSKNQIEENDLEQEPIYESDEEQEEVPDSEDTEEVEGEKLDSDK